MGYRMVMGRTDFLPHDVTPEHAANHNWHVFHDDPPPGFLGGLMITETRVKCEYYLARMTAIIAKSESAP